MSTITGSRFAKIKTLGLSVSTSTIRSLDLYSVGRTEDSGRCVSPSSSFSSSSSSDYVLLRMNMRDIDLCINVDIIRSYVRRGQKI